MDNISSNGSHGNEKPGKLFGDVLGERLNGSAIAAPRPDELSRSAHHDATPRANGLARAAADARHSSPDHFGALWGLGYRRLIPIIPPGAGISPNSSLSKNPKAVGKIPGRKNPAGLWTGFPGWESHEATENDLREWRKWGAGVGLLTGPIDPDTPDGEQLIAIDADVYDVTLAGDVLKIVETHFGILPIRVGRYPKAAYILRLSGPIGAPKVHLGTNAAGEPLAVEISGAGRQIVAEGVHPGTRKPYTWPHKLVPLHELPLVTPEKFGAFIADLLKLPNARLDKGSSSPADRGPVDPERLRGDPETVAKAVRALPNTVETFPDYDDMIEVGCAIRGALPDDPDLGLELFTEWCEKWDGFTAEKPFSETLVEDKWRTFDSPRLGARFLYEKAAKLNPDGFSMGTDVWFRPISAEDAAAQAKADELRALFDDKAPGVGREAFDFEAAGRLSVDALRSVAPPQFVLGTRFQPGVVTLGIGAPGVSKTTFAVLSALAIATGTALTQERVAKVGRVLIVSNEDGRDVLLRRIAGVANVYNLDMRRVAELVDVLSGVDDRRLVFAERSEPRGPIKPGRDLAAFTDYVREKGFVHVVLDPLISLHRGLEENSAADMEQLGDFLRDFARTTGVSLDLLHHSVRNRDKNTEAGAGRADSMRGSSAIEGFVRSAYTLRAMGIDTAKELNLSPDRAAQLVRLDDAKRNYGRRVAREQWFELVSVLPSGERVSPADFLATADDVAAERANASVGVHMLFDVSRERARARIAAAGDKQGRKDAIRSYVALSMTEDTCDQREIVAGFAFDEAKSESRARVEITEAIPTGRRAAARVAAAGQEWFLWREERRSGNSKRVICREATGRIVPSEIVVQAELGAAGNSFEDLFG